MPTVFVMQQPIKRYLRWVLLLTALMLPAIVLAKPQMKSEVAFYIDMYGEIIPQQDRQVARAHKIFERVSAVADHNSKRLPKLVVVNNLNDSWAIALPSGHIVVSRQALKLCHRGATIEQAEARLGFVLGHELAHLANDDFWHQEIDSFLSTNPKTKHIAHFLNKNSRATGLELAADDKGYIYAAMAGFSVDTLVTEKPGEEDFFEFWMRQANSRGGTSHPSPKDRAELLRQRLQSLEKQIDFFNFGVRLSHFGYCDDAVYFLREFQKHFPGRAVLNNLGFCYLQMARKAMNPIRADFYWMPLLLDIETRAAGITRSGARSATHKAAYLKDLHKATGNANGFLKQAIVFLELANKADPSYLAAKINLAVAYLYRGRPHQARAILRDESTSLVKNPIIQGLDALALYEQSDADVDLWPAALSKLEQLAAENNAAPMQTYNIARLLTVRPRALQAQIFWNRLASRVAELPPTIQTAVCVEQNTMKPMQCRKASKKSAARKSWRLPLPENQLKTLTPSIHQSFVTGWKTTSFDWYNDKLFGHVYRHPKGWYELLEMNQFVHMQVIKYSLDDITNLQDYCGFPLRRRQMVIGQIWSCENWAAVTMDNKVREVWWVAR